MKIIEILKKEYPRSFFKRRDPYYVLISCILSLRTKDEVTYPAAERLFQGIKKPEEMLKLSLEEIRKRIYPVGFYKKKAVTIKEISKQLIGKKVPDSIEELMKFKGVGRKTANIVLCYGFGKESMPVDIHVHRISNRIGWIKTKNPDESEIKLRENIPKKYWLMLNELLVKHGQQVCRPVSPFCSKCVIREYCKRIGVVKSR
ncbi:endonuclease III [archaeon]|nr:endonuclease III [archaeon]